MRKLLDAYRQFGEEIGSAGKALDRWRWTARSTVFAAFFAASCFYLALVGKLTDQYVAAITAIHAFLITRAVMEDRKRQNDDANEN